MTAERVISVKLLDDVTECPICTESYNDPRSLPCIHTFCLTCISKWSGGKIPGDNGNCPLCRKEFTVPANGLEELPRNFFIAKLLAMKEVSSSAPEALLCDRCAANSEVPAEKKSRARHFCVECEENLCDSCSDIHSKLKRCRSHQTHVIGGKLPDASTAELPTKCDKHPKEDLKLFCVVCQEALCFMCFATKHTGHRSAEIYEVAADFRIEIQGNISQLAGGIDHLAASLSTYEIKRREIAYQSEKVEAEICFRAEQLKLTVERHKRQLMTELTQLKADKLKEVDAAVNELTHNKTLIESLKKYSEELLKKGSNGDIAREIRLMKLRVEEMKQFYDGESRAKFPQLPQDTLFTFIPMGTVLDTSCNVVGLLKSTTGEISCSPIPITARTKGKSICAVTSSNDQFYITLSDTKQVDVYHASTFDQLRHITLPNAGQWLNGLAVCSANNYLYVSDWDNDAVHKVELSASQGKSSQTSWPVASGPGGLSVNKSGNLLVACRSANKVQEFTSNGTLVGELTDVVGARHAVQLNDSMLVVCQANGTSTNHVSVMSLDGNVLGRYPSTTAAPGHELLNIPSRVAVDKNGFILVADFGSHRILVMNPELTDSRKLPLPLDTPMQNPFGLWFEEPRGRLYVGESEGRKRIWAFDNVFNVHKLFEK